MEREYQSGNRISVGFDARESCAERPADIAGERGDVFITRTDSEGRPLEGRCTYTVTGGELDARWWSVTLYKGEGWLVKNAANRWSVAGNAPPRDAQGNWSFTVSPNPTEGVWLPTGGTPHFDLTLRTYHPRGALLNDPANAKLPTVTRKACA